MYAKKAELILKCDNYFYWYFVMQMKVMIKGLVAHIWMVNPKSEITELKMLNWLKALGLAALGVALEHHTKILSATTAVQEGMTIHKP